MIWLNTQYELQLLTVQLYFLCHFSINGLGTNSRSEEWSFIFSLVLSHHLKPLQGKNCFGVEHPNLSQPNPGPRPPWSPCSNIDLPCPVRMQCPRERLTRSAAGRGLRQPCSHSYPQSKIGVCGCIATALPCPYYCQLLKGQGPATKSQTRRAFLVAEGRRIFCTDERARTLSRPRRLELEKQTRRGGRRGSSSAKRICAE